MSIIDKNCEVEIGALADLDLFALRTCWKAQYGSDAPVRMSREIILRAVAYRIQEQTFGGLSRAAKARLKSNGVTGDAGTRCQRTDPSFKAGAKLIREWNGRTIEVIAMADGRYLYHGAAYRSLSVIAREVTGTRWSGPAFFGLPGKRRADNG